MKPIDLHLLTLLVSLSAPSIAQKNMKLTTRPPESGVNALAESPTINEKANPINNTFTSTFYFSSPESTKSTYPRRISIRIDPSQLNDSKKINASQKQQFLNIVQKVYAGDTALIYGLRYGTFAKVIADNFSYVAVPSADVGFVDQLQVDVTEPNITVGGLLTDLRFNKKRKDADRAALPMLRLSGFVKAGYSEGFGALFSDNVINPGITASAQLHLDIIALMHNLFRKPGNSSYPYTLDVEDFLKFTHSQDSLNHQQFNYVADLELKKDQGIFKRFFTESKKKIALNDTVAKYQKQNRVLNDRLNTLGTNIPMDTLAKYNKMLAEAEFKINEANLKLRESDSDMGKLLSEEIQVSMS